MVFLGDWKVWSDSSLDMKEMTTMQISKEEVMSHFGLKNEQIKLFVTLSSCLYSRNEIEKVKHLKMKINTKY